LEAGAEAERLSLRLASLREGLGDSAGVRRALEAGLERCPESALLREKLVAVYEEGKEWKALADFHVAAAESRANVADRVEELRLAAGVLRRELADPGG